MRYSRGASKVARKPPDGKLDASGSPLRVLSGKFHDCFADTGRREKTVMLLSGDACHRLEPVGEMGSAMLQSPFFHGNSYRVCDIQFQMGTAVEVFASAL